MGKYEKYYDKAIGALKDLYEEQLSVECLIFFTEQKIRWEIFRMGTVIERLR